MNKAVFVTGGTVGSGLACAERYAKEGYDVFITSRNGERAKEAAKAVAEKYGVFGKGYALDIRDEQRVIDILTALTVLSKRLYLTLQIWVSAQTPQREWTFSPCLLKSSGAFLKQTLSGIL